MKAFTYPLLLLVSILLLNCRPAGAQHAADVVASYIAAMGGKEKLQSIHSVYMECVSVLPNGSEVDSKYWKVQGKLYRQELSFGAGSVIVILTPNQGWTSNPRNGGVFAAMTPQQVKNLQWQLDCPGPLVDYAAKGHTVELTGTDTVDGKECYMLKLTLSTGEYITYSIDKKTGYNLMEARKVGSMGGPRRGAGENEEFRIQFSDYQKTPDGYVFPYTIRAGGAGAKTSLEKLEVNKEVNTEALGKPEK